MMDRKPLPSAESRRNPYFDNMKAILIFLVVLGHCISSFNNPGGSGYNWLYRVIFSFHMPAFLFVSGYFASPKPKKTIARMLPLYLIFQIVHIVRKYIEAWLANPEEAHLEFQIFDPEWSLWYLMALMIYSLILPVLDTDDRRKQIRNIFFSFVAGLLFGFNGQDVLDMLAVGRSISLFVFYLTGYYAKKNKKFMASLADPENRRKPAFRNIRIAALCLAATWLICFAIPGWPINGEMFYGNLSYEGTRFTIWLKAATYLISFSWILILVLWVPDRRIPVLGKIGRNTLGVYLFHTLAISVLRNIEPVSDALNGSFLLMFLTAVGLTLLLSLDFFSNILRKIQDVSVEHIKGGTAEEQ